MSIADSCSTADRSSGSLVMSRCDTMAPQLGLEEMSP